MKNPLRRHTKEKDALKTYSVPETDKKEFLALTKRLMDIMVDFSLLTLHTIQEKKKEPLTQKQIDEVISFDLQFRIQQINDPELLDIVRERATFDFLNEQNKK